MLSFIRPDAHPDFATKSAKLLADVRKAVTDRGGTPHSEDFKNREIWSEPRHKQTLAASSDGLAKCAFCERIRDVSRDLDVEHFRPKSEITRWKGDPPLVSDEPPQLVEVGSGYWWLAFSWENYSLACKGCNQAWKRTLFPVDEPRPTHAEGVEHIEHPLLLDPSKPFRTGDHFEWTDQGYVMPRSPEGRATILTCGLNRSTLHPLRLKLLKILWPVLDDFRVGLLHNEERRRNLAVGQLSLLGARDAEFAGMVRGYTEQKLRRPWEHLKRFGLPD